MGAQATAQWDHYDTGARYRLMTEISKQPSAELWAEFLMAVEEEDFEPDVYARIEQAAQGEDVGADLGHLTQPYWEHNLYPRFKKMWPEFTSDVLQTLERMTATVEYLPPGERPVTAAAAAAASDAYQNEAAQAPSSTTPADPQHSYSKTPADPQHLVQQDPRRPAHRRTTRSAGNGGSGCAAAAVGRGRRRQRVRGREQVRRKGARLGRDAGEVSVTGCADHAGFRAQFSELSRKTVTFGS